MADGRAGTRSGGGSRFFGEVVEVLEELVGLEVGIEEGLDLKSEVWVVACGLVEASSSLLGGEFDDLIEEALDLLPALRREGGGHDDTAKA